MTRPKRLNNCRWQHALSWHVNSCIDGRAVFLQQPLQVDIRTTKKIESKNLKQIQPHFLQETMILSNNAVSLWENWKLVFVLNIKKERVIWHIYGSYLFKHTFQSSPVLFPWSCCIFVTVDTKNLVFPQSVIDLWLLSRI